MKVDGQLDGRGGFASSVTHDCLYDLERLFQKTEIK